MEWLEVKPIPEECNNCKEDDCYNCDVAGRRWVLSKEDELRARRILMVRAIEELQQKVAKIDSELERLLKEQPCDG